MVAGVSGSNAFDRIGDERGRNTLNDYDSVGRLMSITDPLGQVSTFAYDNDGRRISSRFV